MTTLTSSLPKISVAPMIDWTDRHCRAFHRVISKHAELYTEMIVDQAVLHGDAERLLDKDAPKENVVLQLGGSDPNLMGKAAKIAAEFGYKKINLNCGCPSDRVQAGVFGAVLMKSPERVGEILCAMRETGAEISIKCRIGVDDQDAERALPALLDAVMKSDVREVIIHARKAWLQGLSPKENREIPPLDYDLAAKMITQYPDLQIALNGGIGSVDAAEAALARGFSSVMIGRAAYQRPYDILSGVDTRFYGEGVQNARAQIVSEMVEYAEAHLQNGGKLHQITRHMLGLFHGEAGGRRWRQILSQEATKPNASPELLLQAMPQFQFT